MVEVDELVGVCAFIWLVGAEGLDVVWGFIEIIDCRVGWEDGVATVGDEGYLPESSGRVSPSSEYDLSIVCDFTSCAVEEDLTACIHKL
jgi:hypothetical protein